MEKEKKLTEYEKYLKEKQKFYGITYGKYNLKTKQYEKW